jgi:hypothetical protein
MAEPNETTINLRWNGEKSDDPEVVGEILGAFGGLLGEVTEAVTGDRDAVRWRVGRMRIICDGCETERREDAAHWIKRDGLDFCPDCQSAAQKIRAERNEG